MTFTPEEGKLMLDMVKARTRDPQPYSDAVCAQSAGIFDYVEKLRQELGDFEFTEPTDRMQRIAYVRKGIRSMPLDLHTTIETQKENIRRFLANHEHNAKLTFDPYIPLNAGSRVVFARRVVHSNMISIPLRCTDCKSSVIIVDDNENDLQSAVHKFVQGYTSCHHATTCPRIRNIEDTQDV